MHLLAPPRLHDPQGHGAHARHSRWSLSGTYIPAVQLTHPVTPSKWPVPIGTMPALHVYVAQVSTELSFDWNRPHGHVVHWWVRNLAPPRGGGDGNWLPFGHRCDPHALHFCSPSVNLPSAHSWQMRHLLVVVGWNCPAGQIVHPAFGSTRRTGIAEACVPGSHTDGEHTSAPKSDHVPHGHGTHAPHCFSPTTG